MAHFDKDRVGDEGFLMQIGTLSGNPVAAAAGSGDSRDPAAPRRLRADLFATGRELMSTLAELLTQRRHAGAGDRRAAAIRCRIQRSTRCATIAAPLRGEPDMARRFNALLRERGVLKGESEILRLARPHRGGHPAHPRRLGFGPRGDRRQLTALFILCHDAGTQRADRGRAHLDEVAGFQEALRRGAAVRQQFARIRCGAGRRSATDDVARIKREIAR